MFVELFQFLNLLLSLFKYLTPKQKEQVVDVFVDLFKNIFKSKKDNKESDVDSTTIQEAVDNITQDQWQGSVVATMAILPSSINEINKRKFTAAMIELVQSDEFLSELNVRINKIDIKDVDLYTEQCSLEMRRLIAEMIRDKKL
ncbi:hypothetical protein [Enterobacter hormaechei]|uniref:hypothetical protein n=1 Tax=Enterobacter hormaechei TaxID=158836 RepID=UPI00037F9CA5|nr:hypothetical protein [Enterobacter hormaechei]OTW36722.1 hypothetical protein CAP57_01750 [Enterobacter kobei]